MSDKAEKLFYEQKNGYELIDETEKAEVNEYCRGYIDFLNTAKTERESVKEAIRLAEANGFHEYVPGQKLSAGEKVYFSNRGKALMLAVIGKRSLAEGINIAGAHVDAPRLDLKQL